MIATTRRGLQQTGSDPEKWTPATRDTADHSLPYITTRAMFDGDIDNDSYAAESCADPRTLAFMRKITVAEDPALTARTSPSIVPTRIRRFSPTDNASRAKSMMCRASSAVRWARADVERKFRGNVGKRWPQSGLTPSCRRCGRSSAPTILTSLLASFRCRQSPSAAKHARRPATQTKHSQHLEKQGVG